MQKDNRIKAVELVHRIRDIQAAQMAGKSDVELMEFFNAAGRLAQEKIGQTAKATVKRRVELADSPDAKFIPHEDIEAWLETWGANNERKPPECA